MAPPVGGGFSTKVSALAVRPDGKIMMGGNFSTVWGAERSGIARLNLDGSLDTTFAPTNVPPDIRAIAVQPDGKVVLGIGYPSITTPSVMRLNEDGTTDTNFTAGFAPSGSLLRGALTLLVQADGRIVAGGGTVPGGSGYLLRLESTGRVDVTFSRYPNGIVESLALAAAGRVLAGGRFTTPRLGLALLETNGLPVAYSSDLGTDVVVHALARQPDGRLWVGGNFVKQGVFTNIVRLTSTGTFDSSTFPMSLDGEVRCIALDPDNRILVTGDFTGFLGWQCAGLVRLKSTGELDTGFNPAAGAGLGNAVLAIQSDGLILIGGACTNGRPLLRLLGGDSSSGPPSVNIELSQQRVTVGQTVTLRSLVTSARLPHNGRWTLNGTNVLLATGPALTLTNVTVEQAGSYVFSTTNDFGTGSGTGSVEVVTLPASVGKLDTSYNRGTRPQVMDGVLALALQPDGGAIIGGGFNSFNGLTRTNVARVDGSGNVDTAFNTDVLAYGTYPAWVYAFARQNDGKLVVVGSFNRHLFRCEPSGSLDTAFLSSYGTVLYAVALQPDGRVLVGTPSGIRRLSATGYNDSTFLASSVSQAVRVIVVQPDGKILAGGDYSGTAVRPALARLNPAGDLDYSFDARITGQVTALVVQESGKIVVGGKFQTAGGASRKGLARLNADGSLDTTFDIGTGFYSSVPVLVTALAIQSDGKVLVGGGFSSVAGIRRNAVVRLNPDGRVDPTFDTSTGPDGIVYAIGLQPDGNVVIAGDFQKVNDIPRDRLARLYGDNPPPLPPRLGVPVRFGEQWAVSFLSEPRRQFTLEFSDALDSQQWMSGSSAVGDGTTMTLIDTNTPSSRRFYRVRVE